MSRHSVIPPKDKSTMNQSDTCANATSVSPSIRDIQGRFLKKSQVQRGNSTGSVSAKVGRLKSLQKQAEAHIAREPLELEGSASVNTPTVAPPAPPSSTSSSNSSTANTPRNVRDALSILNSNKAAASAANHHQLQQDSSSSAAQLVKSSLNGNGGSTGASSGGSSNGSVSPAPAEMDSNRRAYMAAADKTTKTPPDVAPRPSATPAANANANNNNNQPTSVRKARQLEGYVGFANLPNQVYRKAVKRGFEFTLMVVGESGLGKSTLINSMFLTDIYSAAYPGPSERIKKTVKVDTNKVLLKESGVNLTLTIVDTPGFGDAVDNSNCWEPVTQFVETQYEAFLDAETRVNRVQLPDTRVHACLYFIAPSGHGLKPLDVEYMQRLHDKVNIIPVIAKSDTMTPEEISHFKTQILTQIAAAKIRIYEFPDFEDAEENERRENAKLKQRVPFAVVGSNTLIENAEGKKVRGRKYPWGVVDIESLDHCDFIPLRNMLIRSHLQDLKEVTNTVHYENFRCRKLAGVAGFGNTDKIPNRNPLAQIEEDRREHSAKLQKMEKEMEEVFERKVREKKQKLRDSQLDLEHRHRESKDKLESQKCELEARMAAFEQEKSAWERANNITIDELKRLSMESLDGGGKKKKSGGALSGVSFRMGRS